VVYGAVMSTSWYGFDQVSSAINYANDRVAQGYVGRVLTTMIGYAPEVGRLNRSHLPSRSCPALMLPSGVIACST
jgi:hypothetical protein